MTDSRPFSVSSTKISFEEERAALAQLDLQSIARLRGWLGNLLAACDELGARYGEGPEAQSAALELADIALSANAEERLSGPILQKIWGYALSEKAGANAMAARMIENTRHWLFPASNLGSPAAFALGVAIAALRDQVPLAKLSEKIARFETAGVSVEAAMDWIRESERSGPRIMGADNALAALEAHALGRAACIRSVARLAEHASEEAFPFASANRLPVRL